MLEGIDNIPWNQEKIPLYLNGLRSKSVDNFSKNLSDLGMSILHQGTINEDTLNVIPFLWKIMEYYFHQNQDLERVYKILELIHAIFPGWDSSIYEPFGYLFGNNSRELYERVQDGLPILLSFFKTADVKIRTLTLHILRNLGEKSIEIVEHLRKLLCNCVSLKEHAELVLTLALLAKSQEDHTFLNVLKKFLHPDYPNIIRIHALIGVLILSDGKISNILSTAVINLYYKNGQFDEENIFPGDITPEDLEISPLTEDEQNYLNKLKLNANNSQFDDSLPFLYLEYWPLYFFYLKLGANEILAPILLDIFSKAEEEREEIIPSSPDGAEGLYYILNSLLYMLFPKGFKRWTKQINDFDPLQIQFLNSVIDKLEKQEIFTGFHETLLEYDIPLESEELQRFIEKSSEKKI